MIPESPPHALLRSHTLWRGGESSCDRCGPGMPYEYADRHVADTTGLAPNVNPRLATLKLVLGEPAARGAHARRDCRLAGSRRSTRRGAMTPVMQCATESAQPSPQHAPECHFRKRRNLPNNPSTVAPLQQCAWAVPRLSIRSRRCSRGPTRCTPLGRHQNTIIHRLAST